jgi:predicted transcriptional regulator
MQYKSFAGALEAFLAQECPAIGGLRTRQVLVQEIESMVRDFYPATSHLRAGQIQWTTVAADERASYGKSMRQTRLTSVVLDLGRPEDIRERAEGKHLREIKQEAAARLFNQAYEQKGCLTHAEVGVLLKISPPTVGKYVREWEQTHERLLPRRGTIHDMGPTLTHKRQIVYKLFHEGKSVEQVCRETLHSPEAVHRYITAFKQVLLCQRKGLSVEETAFAVKHSVRLVCEYRELIAEIGEHNSALRNLLKYESENSTKENSQRS